MILLLPCAVVVAQRSGRARIARDRKGWLRRVVQQGEEFCLRSAHMVGYRNVGHGHFIRDPCPETNFENMEVAGWKISTTIMRITLSFISQRSYHLLLNLKGEAHRGYVVIVAGRHSALAAIHGSGRNADDYPRLLPRAWRASLHDAAQPGWQECTAILEYTA